MSAQAGEPGNTPLDSFPLELLHSICAELPRASSDVQNFRLACKTFAAVGTDYLLCHLYTIFKRTHLDRLVEMSHHPAARFLEAFHYQAARLPQRDSFETWKAHGFDIQPRPRKVRKVLDEAYTRYR